MNSLKTFRRTLISVLFVVLTCSVILFVGSCDVVLTPDEGKTGKSAYDIWLDNGYEGSETDFLEWLRGLGTRGEKGDTGAQGEQGIQGEKGEKGDRGEDGQDGRDGKDGVNGKDGISIVNTSSSIETNENCEVLIVFTFTFSDGSVSVNKVPYLLADGSVLISHDLEVGFDSEYHWKACLKHTNVIIEKTAHSFDDKYVCTKCGYAYSTEGLEYKLSTDKTSYICSSIGTATDTNIVIASAYNGLPVTGIGENAFGSNVYITSVFIPDSVNKIEDNAFNCCAELTNITFGSGLKEIGVSTFSNCVALTDIDLKNVVIVGTSAFINCTKLTTVTALNVETIGEKAFSGCRVLTSISFGTKLTAIGNLAFNNCKSLTEISLPASLTSVAANSFSRCPKLTTVTFGGTIETWDSFKISLSSSVTSIICSDGTITPQNA
ncbi:MAG: collagen-like protein [Candidatus Borkfalkiaceae bacterium]|nr:collagen-like protein [Christensenellaceae bacterium]